MINLLLQSSPSGLGGFLPIILIMLVIYFFMIRPQINRHKEEEKFQSELKKGDQVITTGGLHGKINGIQDNTITLGINNNANIIVDKNSISRERTIQKKK